MPGPRARGVRDDADGAPVTIPLAINADSLATWVLDALAPLAGAVCFDIHREDQAHTSALLREGTAMAAITADAEPVPGCSSSPLGQHDVPLHGLARRSPPAGSRGGVSTAAFARAPVVVFDRKDDLQHRYLRRRSRRRLAPADALRARIGRLPVTPSGSASAGEWSRTCRPHPHEQSGELIDLDPAGASRIALYWQQWKLRSPSLDLVAEAIRGRRADPSRPAP